MIQRTIKDRGSPIPDIERPINKTARGKKQNPSFKNAAMVNGVIAALEGSEIMGPFVVDLISMNIPRVAVDASRGKAAAWETARRETLSTNNGFFMPAIYAMGTGAVLAGTKRPNLFIGSDMVDELNASWEGNDVQKFAKDNLRKVKGLVGNDYVSFSDKHVSKLAPRVEALIHGTHKKGDSAKKLAKEAVQMLKAEKKLKIGKNNIKTDMKTYFCNFIDMGKALNKIPKNIPEPLKEAAKLATKIKRDVNIKSRVGVGLTLAGGFGLQYLNRYLTSKETGTTAFVGLPNYENSLKKDTAPENPKKTEKKSKIGLWGEKIGASVAMGYLTLGSVLNKWTPKTIMPELTGKKLGKLMQMKRKMTSLTHFKMIIGPTLIGRMFAADDKYELRETAVRDLLMYSNFLVLNEFVTQLTAYGLAKKIGRVKDVFNGPVDEVLKTKGRIKRWCGVLTKLHSRTDGEMVADGAGQIVRGIKSKSALTGWIYSSVLLGVGIPLLNKWMTNTAFNRDKQGQNSFLSNTGMDSFKKKLQTAEGF